MARSLDQSLTITASERALAYGRPIIHHSYQCLPKGVQYAAGDYVQGQVGSSEPACGMARTRCRRRDWLER